MSYLCGRRGCADSAVGAVQLNIPAKGVPVQEHDPVTLLTGLVLCERHMKEATAKEFFDADPRLEDAVASMVKGIAPPDFDGAFVTSVALDSDDWKRLVRLSDQHRQGPHDE